MRSGGRPRRGGDASRPAEENWGRLKTARGRGGALASHSSVLRRFVALSSASSGSLRAAACAESWRGGRRAWVSRASDGRRARVKVEGRTHAGRRRRRFQGVEVCARAVHGPGARVRHRRAGAGREDGGRRGRLRVLEAHGWAARGAVLRELGAPRGALLENVELDHAEIANHDTLDQLSSREGPRQCDGRAARDHGGRTRGDDR